MLGCTSARAPERRLAHRRHASGIGVRPGRITAISGTTRLTHLRHGRGRVARPNQTRTKCKDKRRPALGPTNSGLASQHLTLLAALLRVKRLCVVAGFRFLSRASCRRVLLMT